MMGVLLSFLAVAAVFGAVGLWYWAGFVLAILVVLGAFELASVRARGKTLSQEFKEFAERKPVWAGVILAVLFGALGWIAAHLFTGV